MQAELAAALSAQRVALQVIPARKDNYIYLLHDEVANVTAVIDPADAAPVLEVLHAKGWGLEYILVTHHHGDHIGGIAELKARTGCTVYGYAGDAHRITGISHPLEDNATLCVGRFEAQLWFIPGHTLGHVAYYFPALELLFCGDTLFSLGCGRLFEGSAEQMFTSLMRIATLPDTTWVCCGHEYSHANARFAVTIDADNAALQQKAAQIEALRAQGKPTLPCLLGEEKACNPFLRCASAEEFAALRKRKDVF